MKTANPWAYGADWIDGLICLFIHCHLLAVLRTDLGKPHILPLFFDVIRSPGQKEQVVSGSFCGKLEATSKPQSLSSTLLSEE